MISALLPTTSSAPHRVLQVALSLTLLLSALGAYADGEKPALLRKATVAEGLHLWYEIKADPEDSARMIICGTKWDAFANTPFGFVYFSADAGQTWRNVLEDRSSIWVTEHSCAFGFHHRAYFVSDAAKETEIGPSPKQGTTRLFFSADSGEHWAESAKTGWTDYSTSAVSKTSEKLYTFFHASWMSRDASRSKGNDLGVVVFSPDGRTVTGPFFSLGTSDQGYTGIYPSDALSLRTGAVIALYYATRQALNGTEIELGTMRADQSADPAMLRTVVARPQIDRFGSCLNFDNGSMAYDAEHDRIFVIYQDGCQATSRIMLATSEDEGRTWSNSVAISVPKNLDGRIYSPSLVAVSEHVLGLLWEDKPCSPRWFLSYIENGTLRNPPIALSGGSDKPEISNDSLWTVIAQPSPVLDADPTYPAEAAIAVNVRAMVNALWRTDGVLLTNGKIFAVWSSGTNEGMRLHSGLVGIADPDSTPDAANQSELNDVTRDTLLVFAGDRNDAGQSYDNANRTLDICGSLRNRAHHAIESPIEVRLESLSSQWGSISVLNSTNGVAGTGAVWDITGLLTGDRIPPGTMSNPFCMSFRLGITANNLAPIHMDLLSFSVRVFARRDGNADVSGEAVQLGR
jgi:hypothetical protein